MNDPFKLFSVIFVLILLPFERVESDIKTTSNEKILFESLFQKYDKRLRPSDTIEIKLSLNLNQIITLIEQEQTLIVNVFIDHEWTDQRLKWNPKKYRNISMLRVPSDYIWM